MSVTKLYRKKEESEDLLEKSLSREDISKILEMVTYDRAFYFFEGIDKPTGEFAVSLSDFCNKIYSVNSECLAFHLKRGDFQKWISEVIGDVELATRINKIKIRGKALRNTLHEFVGSRIKELQDTWHFLLVLH